MTDETKPGFRSAVGAARHGLRPSSGADVRRALAGIAAQDELLALGYEAHNAHASATGMYARILGSQKARIEALEAELRHTRSRDRQDEAGAPGEERGRQEPEQAKPVEAGGEGPPRAGGAVQAPEQVGVEVRVHGEPIKGVTVYVLEEHERIVAAAKKAAARDIAREIAAYVDGRASKEVGDEIRRVFGDG